MACSHPDIRVRGVVMGLHDQTVFISSYGQREFEVVDSTYMRRGEFTFAMDEVYPDMYYVTFGENPARIPFIAERGEIDINADFDSGARITVSGTPSNDLVTRYNSLDESYQARMDRLKTELHAYKSASDTINYDRTETEIKNLESGNNNGFRNLIIENGSLAGAAYLLTTVDTYGYSVGQMDSLLSLLSPALRSNRFSDMLNSRRSALVRVSAGNPAPDFALPLPESGLYTLSSARGSHVLLHFWASESEPSMAVMPALNRLYDRYKKDMTIISVSLDTDRVVWHDALSSIRMRWVNVSAMRGWSSDVVSSYGVAGIPHLILIDAEGNIVHPFIPPSELETVVSCAITPVAAE